MWVISALTLGRTVKFGQAYNNQYHAEYFNDQGILTLSVNGTDYFHLSAKEAKHLKELLNTFIELEEQE